MEKTRGIVNATREDSSNANALSLAEKKVVARIITLFGEEHIALPENHIAEVLRMLPEYKGRKADETAKVIKRVLTYPGSTENGEKNDKIVNAIASIVYRKEDSQSVAVETEINTVKKTRKTENEPKIVLYRDWLMALKKGFSRNKVDKEAIEKTLMGVKDFSYSEKQAKKTASELIWVFNSPIDSIEKADIERFDIISKIAILLRDNIPDWKLAKRVINSMGGEFSSLLLELEHERFEGIRSSRTPEAAMTKIIKRFNELSEGVPERYMNYKLVFSEEAEKEFYDYYRKHGASIKSEFNQLCESLPYLKTELLLRRVGRSPARGQISGKQIAYKGKNYDAYHAAPNYINLRAEYIIADRGAEKEIVITGFYVAHPTGNSSEGFR